MSVPFALSLMILYLAIGYVIGRTTRRPGASSEKAPAGHSLQHSARLLDDVRRDLSHQTAELKGFRQELALCGTDGSQAEFLRACLTRAEMASRHFEERFAERADAMARQNLAQLTELAALLDEFTAHRAVTQGFTERLGEVVAQADLTGVAASLGVLVGTVLDSHTRLEQELRHARETIVRQHERLRSAEQEARMDSLTRLLNRRAFGEQLAASHAEYDRGGEPFTVVMFDIDRFKQLNDQYGHAAGDAALSVAGRILADCIRPYDSAARTGGEEFCILLRRTRLAEAARIAERVRARIEGAEVCHGGNGIRFTISGGAAEVQKGESEADLLQRADGVLYAAKQAGRNRIQLSHAEELLATAS